MSAPGRQSLSLGVQGEAASSASHSECGSLTFDESIRTLLRPRTEVLLLSLWLAQALRVSSLPRCYTLSWLLIGQEKLRK